MYSTQTSPPSDTPYFTSTNVNKLMNLFETRVVPNQFPTKVGTPYKLAIIGEAPGRQEDEVLRPFVGGAGDMLNSLLQDAGIQREACYVGNICQQKPPDNKLVNFDWFGTEIQGGIQQLRADIHKADPNLCLLLGGVALHAGKSAARFPWTKTKKNKEDRYPISSWRGSLFMCDIPTSPFYGRKCLGAYHPAALMRVYSDVLITRFDFRRARIEASFPHLVLPERTIVTDVTLDYLVSRFEEILRTKCRIGLDIEGYVDNMKCVSFALSPSDVFIVPFTNMDGLSHWDLESETTIWTYLTKILSDPEIPKVLQQCLYDGFVFWYGHHLLIRGIVDDTMLKHWEYLCETEKALDFQTSIYTREPYYKDDRGASDRKTFWTYCCRDSAVTMECCDAQTECLKNNPGGLAHYDFNKRMLKPFLYMQGRGFRFDSGTRDKRVKELREKAESLKSKVGLASGVEVNVNSPKQMVDFLYNKLGLPVQYKRAPKYSDKEPSPTANFEALLNLAMMARSADQKDILMNCIRWRETNKRASDLTSIGVDPDGRCRFSLNVVGTITGRVSCYESATGSGTNGQTIRKEDRDLFLADSDDHEIGEMDLRGADGWTVAAHCARLGDPTMLEDLLAGVRIPSVIALITKHGAGINKLDRTALKLRCKEIDKGSHLDFSCKQVQHGTNYGMKPPTVALRVFIESYGEVQLSDAEAAVYQNAYLSRYRGILHWHDWMRQQVLKGFYIAATGHKRVIQGRRYDENTIKELLADEPQQNTTYITNKAARRLWDDPTNRSTRRLRAEPLHQMHDALITQWRVADREYALSRIPDWFNNPLLIANQQIVIPYEGHRGPSWGQSDASL